MARSSAAALLLAVVAATDALAVGRFLGVRRHVPRAAPAMQAVFGSDDGEADRDFSDESTRRMAARLNGILGRPQDEPALEAARSRGTGIPFIDKHFPSRREMTRDARSALAELADDLQDDLRSMPRIAVNIAEDEGGYTVVLTCSGVEAEQELEVALEEGVLMLTLTADASSKILVPVPLPADVGSEITSLTHGDGKVTVRMAKDPTRASDAEDSPADENEEEGEEVLVDRMKQVLKALGLSMSTDDTS